MPQGLPAHDEPTHIDVGQQRGKGRALWAAPSLVLVPRRPARPTPFVGLFHRCHQPHLDQPQEVPIADAARQRFDEFGVRDAVEVAGQIGIDHLGMPRVHMPMDLPDGVQGTVVRPVGVLLRLQVGLEDRLQDQHHRHLRHAVPDRTDPQRTLLAIRFRDEDASCRARRVQVGGRPEDSPFGRGEDSGRAAAWTRR